MFKVKNRLAAIKNQVCRFLFCFNILFKPQNWKKFLKGEKKEIKQLRRGQENTAKFCHDSLGLVKDIFIPHAGNNFRPKALRTKSLLSYALLVIIVKIFVTGFLFFTYPSPAELSEIVSAKMTELANQARQEAGVETLKANDELAKAALAKGQDMIERQYFSHNTPDGKKPWDWINKNDFNYVYAGENLAMDFTSAEIVQEAFMKSPTHRKNILNPNYKEIGIAVVSGQMHSKKTVLLVEFFGTQRKDSLTLAPLLVEEKNYPESVASSENVKSAEVEKLTEDDLRASVRGESLSPSAEGVIVVATETKNSRALVDLVIEYSNIFFMTVIIFILITLSLNVFIKIEVQDYPLIIQAVLAIAIITAVTLVKFHFVEEITPQTLIL